MHFLSKLIMAFLVSAIMYNLAIFASAGANSGLALGLMIAPLIVGIVMLIVSSRMRAAGVGMIGVGFALAAALFGASALVESEQQAMASGSQELPSGEPNSGFLIEWILAGVATSFWWMGLLAGFVLIVGGISLLRARPKQHEEDDDGFEFSFDFDDD